MKTKTKPYVPDSEQLLIAIETLALAGTKEITINVPISMKAEHWLTVQTAAYEEKKEVGKILSEALNSCDEITSLWDEHCNRN